MLADSLTSSAVWEQIGGHFRAGFDEFFTPDRIIEVDCPGLTSPTLHSFEWTRLPRPLYPLDPETQWNPPTQP